MKFRLRRVAKQLLLVTAYVAFATKLLIPVGYMPSAIADGWPIKLCDAGFTVPAHSGHAGHHGHDHSDGGHDNTSHELQWKHCPVGALAAAGAIPVEYRLDLRPPESEDVPFHYVSHSTAAPVTGFRSRAPPLATPTV